MKTLLFNERPHTNGCTAKELEENGLSEKEESIYTNFIR